MPTNITQWAIYAVIALAVAGCVYVMLGVTGIVIPYWIVTLFWICLAAFVIIKAIQFLGRQANS